MSPLDEFAARWNAVGMPVPFVEAVNTPVDTDDLPALWGSAMLQSQTRGDITMGSQPYVEETGQIVVGLFAKSGTGRSSLDAAVTALRTHFHGWLSADYLLEFTSVEGPDDVEPQGNGEWYELAMTVPYILRSRRDLVIGG